MQTSITWAGGAAFIGETPAGHKVIMDGPPEGGGRNLGPRPMEVLLLGMGACASYDVVTILRKARQAISDCRADITAHRADQDPKVFTEIHIHFTVVGRDVKQGHVERAIALSAEKYCSASIMLGKTAAVSHTFEIRGAD
ncbi:MAG: OsmC family protein [Gammaproteobacteria bacterium]|nr:OsmC family protein [Gammaproteobacteria bacterium]